MEHSRVPLTAVPPPGTGAGGLDKVLKAALGERRVKVRRVNQIYPETAW